MCEEELVILQNIQYALDNVGSVDFEFDDIQGLLDLYNKEKLNSSKLSEQLNKEKEKNKELYEDNQKQWEERCRLTFEFDNYTSKDKIKEIIYPTPTNPISYEIQTSDMYRKILELLGEE